MIGLIGTDRKNIEVKRMCYCPMTTKKCREDCAWYVEGVCAVSRLNDIENQMEYVQEALNNLEETVAKKTFVVE